MSATPPYPLPDLNAGPRNFITTAQDHGGVALVLCTLMAVWAVLCLIVRVYMRITVSGPIGLDDYMCGISTIFAVIQMIVSCIAISFGFGKSTALLTSQQIESASKSIYVAQLFYIITLTLTKCTVALLLARIVFVKGRVRICYGVLVICVVWGFASFIAEAVRCTGSPPWNVVGNNQCSNMLVAWQAITAFNIATEALLFALPIWLVYDLQTDRLRKFTVVAVFSLRLPVVAAAILRVHYLSQTIGSAQPLLKGVIPFICLNVEMHYGLMAATWPTLKPFVGAFNTGWGTYDTRGVSGYGHSSGSYAMQSLERKNQRQASARSRSLGGSNINQSRDDDRNEGPDKPLSAYGKSVTHVRSLHAKSPTEPKRSDSTSSASSKQMIIRQTMTCEVHYEDDEDARREHSSSRGDESIEYIHRPR